MATAATITLATRLQALEAKHHGCDQAPTDDSHDGSTTRIIVVDEAMRRARRAVEEAECYSSVWKWVPPSYYHWTLQQRATYLGAPSIQYLCKSLLLENKKYSASSSSSDDNNNNLDRTNAQYLLVVLQYAATLDVQKLTSAVRKMRSNVRERLDESAFEWRVASSATNDALTGYAHNSVTPFGLLCQPDQVLHVLAAPLVPLKRFWMGGGTLFYSVVVVVVVAGVFCHVVEDGL